MTRTRRSDRRAYDTHVGGRISSLVAIVAVALTITSAMLAASFTGTAAYHAGRPPELRTHPPIPGSPRAFPVTFNATGLPADSTWSVTLGNTTETGSGGGEVVFTEPNGSYSYELASPSGYRLIFPGSEGTVHVDGVPNSVIGPSIGAGRGPYAVAYDPANGYLYVTNVFGDNLTVINAIDNRVVVPSIGVGNGPTAVAYDPANGFLYVSNWGSDNVTVVNAATDRVVIPSIGVGRGPDDVAYDPANGYLYVANEGSDSVTAINGATDAVVVPSLEVGIEPDSVTYDAANHYLYVTNLASDNVTVIDGTTDTVVLPSIGTGSSPYAAAYDRANGHLFVVNYGSDNLTVLNGTSNSVADPSIGVGNGPIDVVYDPVNGYLYVTNYGDPIDGSPGDNVTVIDGATDRVAVPGIAVGVGPAEAAYDAANGCLYVTNQVSDNVTVINANGRLVSSWEVAYTVTFTETGLPIGTAWSVQAAADAGPSWSANSTRTTTSLALPAGTYTYTISAAGYRTVTETDQIVRGNSGLTVAVALTPMNSPPFPWIGGLVGAAVVAMVSAAILVLLRRERSPPRSA